MENSRVIKFRAWDERHKKMYYDVGLLNGVIYLPTGKMLTTTMILQQFTGLHDKTGKEIYEGDIVTDDPKNYDKIEKIYLHEVKFEPSLAGWLPFVYHGGNEPHLDECEVIGNVWEDPELVNQA
jgi:hypothetical protein